MKRRWPAILIALLTAPTAAAAAPGFDCADRGSAAERLVCTDPTLAALDREHARRLALACQPFEDPRGCLLKEYLRRIHRLLEHDPEVRALTGRPPSRSAPSPSPARAWCRASG